MPEHNKAKAYHRGKRFYFYLTLLLDTGLLLFFQFSGLSVALRKIAADFFANIWLLNAAYLGLFCLGAYLIHLPLSFFIDYSWEHRFGLSNQRITAWLWDDIKKALLSLIIILLFVEVLYFILRVFPQHWWIGAALFWLFLSLFLARIMPNVILPLFYHYKPVKNEELRVRIKGLFDQCRVYLEDVFAIDFSTKTKKANAFVCGLGKKRRVVLTDNLIDQFDIREIESVVAHELGHYVARDTLKLIAVNTAVIMLAFFLTDKFLNLMLSFAGGLSIGDIAGLPLFALALMLLGLVTSPVINAYSRYLERRADRFSLQLTGDADAFSQMIQKLGQMNLAEFQPSRFDVFMFYDHPPIAERVRSAELFREQRSS